jgi:hypothetical protein
MGQGEGSRVATKRYQATGHLHFLLVQQPHRVDQAVVTAHHCHDVAAVQVVFERQTLL